MPLGDQEGFFGANWGTYTQRCRETYAGFFKIPFPQPASHLCCCYRIHLTMMTNWRKAIKFLLKSSLDNYILPGTLTGTEILWPYLIQWQRHLGNFTFATVYLFYSRLEARRLEGIISAEIGKGDFTRQDQRVVHRGDRQWKHGCQRPLSEKPCEAGEFGYFKTAFSCPACGILSTRSYLYWS